MLILPFPSASLSLSQPHPPLSITRLHRARLSFFFLISKLWSWIQPPSPWGSNCSTCIIKHAHRYKRLRISLFFFFSWRLLSFFLLSSLACRSNQLINSRSRSFWSFQLDSGNGKEHMLKGTESCVSSSPLAACVLESTYCSLGTTRVGFTQHEAELPAPLISPLQAFRLFRFLTSIPASCPCYLRTNHFLFTLCMSHPFIKTIVRNVFSEGMSNNGMTFVSPRFRT